MKPLIRVMLVDDEVLAVRHIRNMIAWEEHGFQIIGEYTNPKKALDDSLRLKPQLILADIKMPALDGISFSRSIMENDDQVKIILLTSYKEFEYAKQALRLGAYDYWVKHEVNAEFLTIALAKLKVEIESSIRTIHTLRRQAWLKYIEGGELTKDHSELLQPLLSEHEGKLSMILIQLDAEKNEHVSLEAEGMFELTWQTSRSSGDETLSVLDTVRLSENIWMVVTQLENSVGSRKVWESIQAYSLQLQGKIREVAGRAALLVITGQTVSEKHLPKLHARLTKVMGSAVFFGTHRLLSIEEHGHLLKQADLDLEEIERMIHHARDLGMEEELANVIRSAFRQIVAAADSHALTQLCTLLQRILISWSGDDHEAEACPPYGVDELCTWYVHRYIHVMRTMHNERRYSRKVKLTVDYMRKHYAQDITIESLADAVCLSGEHLRHLFKEETGQTILEYLTNIRIARAKQLLDEGRYKIYEIADQVGYRSGQYFSQVFRKATGIGPQDYAAGRGKHS